MDNKYGLGSAKVAQAHHDAHRKDAHVLHPAQCRFCAHNHLTHNPMMQDYACKACGQWQNDVPHGYATGRSSDY